MAASLFMNCSADLTEETEAAIQALDKFETQEYREAMDIVPRLVETEMPIRYFLYAANFDINEAAKRLAAFWKYRKILFGERWLLPMTQTGTGTLTELEISFLRTGFGFVIERQNTGPLAVVDFSKAFHAFERARALGVDTRILVERVGMYFVVAFKEELSKGPTTLIHPVTSSARPAIEIRTRWWEFVKTASPVRLVDVVVAQSYEECKQELLEFLRYQSALVLEMSTKILPRQIYASSTHGTLSLLESQGIARECVPNALGGNFAYDTRVAEWARMRMEMESFLKPPPAPLPAVAPVGLNVMDAFGKPAGKRSKNNVLIKRKPSLGQSEADFRRERNRLYVKRFQQKQELGQLGLTDQKRQLERENAALMQRSRQLEQALLVVTKLVEQYGGGH